MDLKRIKMRLLGFILLFLGSLAAYGQGVEFEASAPSVVEVGEQFRLSYSLNRKGTDLQIPTLDGFTLLMGPSTGSSSSFSSINGKVTQSVSYTYTYVLEGTKEGTFQIPPATITVEGKEYRSNAISIEVVKGSGNHANRSNRRVDPTEQAEGNVAVNENNLFVKVDVSRRNLYIGESLVATIKVYSKVNLVSFGRTKFPAFDGFLAEDIPTPQQIELVRETYNGEIYRVGVLRKVLLFPQHTGEITIEPFEVECIVRQQLASSRSFFDDFFGNYRDIKALRLSRPVKINVRELPVAGRPLGFSGTVGDISMRTSLSADTVKANDALTYKVTFSGVGNLKLISAPAIDFPTDFESYEPKVTKDIKTGENGMRGTVTYEYVLIPRYAGDYKIPAVTFSYFDPAAHAYRTVSGETYEIHVLKGNGSTSGENTTSVQSFKKEDVRQLGQDIRFIRTGDLQLRPKGGVFFGTVVYWLAFIIPFVLFVIGAILNRRRIKANADLVRVKNKAANKMARKRMKSAAVAMKNRNTEQFYEEVLKALWGYVSYKLNIDMAELNRDNISDILQRKSVESTLIQDFITVLDTCEFARYAPAANPDQEMDQVYENGIAIITKLDKAIK